MIIRSGQACFGGAQSINWVAALHEEEELGGYWGVNLLIFGLQIV